MTSTSDGEPVRVAEVMTEPFISVRPHMVLADAADRMRRHRVRTAPVLTAEGRLVGVLSESDLERARLAHPAVDDRGGAPSGAVSVADVMSPYVVTVSPRADVTEAAEVMRRGRLRWLAVVDDQRHLVGVLSRSAIPHPRG